MDRGVSRELKMTRCSLTFRIFSWLNIIVNMCKALPIYRSRSVDRKLCHQHIVHTAVTVADQQLPCLVALTIRPTWEASGTGQNPPAGLPPTMLLLCCCIPFLNKRISAVGDFILPMGAQEAPMPLISFLPYCVCHPLARFIGYTEKNLELAVKLFEFSHIFP